MMSSKKQHLSLNTSGFCPSRCRYTEAVSSCTLIGYCLRNDSIIFLFKKNPKQFLWQPGIYVLLFLVHNHHFFVSEDVCYVNQKNVTQREYCSLDSRSALNVRRGRRGWLITTLMYLCRMTCGSNILLLSHVARLLLGGSNPNTVCDISVCAHVSSIPAPSPKGVNSWGRGKYFQEDSSVVPCAGSSLELLYSRCFTASLAKWTSEDSMRRATSLSPGACQDWVWVGHVVIFNRLEVAQAPWAEELSSEMRGGRGKCSLWDARLLGDSSLGKTTSGTCALVASQVSTFCVTLCEARFSNMVCLNYMCWHRCFQGTFACNTDKSVENKELYGRSCSSPLTQSVGDQ